MSVSHLGPVWNRLSNPIRTGPFFISAAEPQFQIGSQLPFCRAVRRAARCQREKGRPVELVTQKPLSRKRIVTQKPLVRALIRATPGRRPSHFFLSFGAAQHASASAAVAPRFAAVCPRWRDVVQDGPKNGPKSATG